MKAQSAKRKGIQLELFRPASDRPAGEHKSAAEIEAHNQQAQLQPLFIKKHDATRLHYDLRLGWNGVLISFVLPEGPSDYSGAQRRAIQMEDHKRENAPFEGIIPKDRYGAGTMLLWDLGMWKPCSGYSHVDECLRNGTLKFTLYGAKLKGDWTLVRIQGRRSGPGTVWLLTKEPDVFARSKEARSILEEAPNSVSTGRTLEQIRRDGDTTKKREPEPTLF